MVRFSVLGEEDPMAILCRMVTEVKYEDLPANVIDHAKRSILDTMAVTVGGSAMEGISAVVDLVKGNEVNQRVLYHSMEEKCRPLRQG